LRHALQGGAGTMIERYQRPPSDRNRVQDQQREYAVSAHTKSVLRYLTCIDNRYVVAEDAGRLLLIDSASLLRYHIISEMEQQLRNHGVVRSKPLLIPVVADIPEPQIKSIMSQENRLQPLGMSIDQIGPGELILRSLPDAMIGIDAEKLLQVLVGITSAAELPDLEQLVFAIPIDSFRTPSSDAVLSWVTQYPDSQAVRRLTAQDLDDLLRKH
jgi:DNA mismatch repair ATPase MutL